MLSSKSNRALIGMLVGVLGSAVSGLAFAQPSGDGSDAVRNALGKQEGDADQTDLLKETLTARDKQYSLLKKGKLSTTYDFSYSYIGQQSIDARFSEEDNQLTLFKIENTRSHSFTNTISADYGLRDNLTGTASVSLAPSVRIVVVSNDVMIY